ncbi:ATP-dependent helicase [Thermoplasma sp.]|uniref:ATP-dependent helicase n=1 Tax=Thermoplasma sp. TaxID=1973142 RepID=UPI00127E5390|nr:ATP-dependent helicase [Thermoplasma sp.]KAA8923477.1 MAG: ATP-dependent helicase [Thermoplasma sp.]
MESETRLFRIEDFFPFLDRHVSKWFDNNYTSLTEPQKYAIPLIHSGSNVLVSSPTGTGKTMTAFLTIINELVSLAKDGRLEDRVYCVYISPLKALANDINKNLKFPLDGIYSVMESEGIKVPRIRISVRSGDTTESERQKMVRKPPHILITTPESFSLALSSPRMRDNLRNVRYVIIDEIHEISSTKRGSLLSANLERLNMIAPGVIRIGLSATQSPIEEIAKYLVGFDGERPRPCQIVEVRGEKHLDLRTITPVPDLTRVSYEVANDRMYDIIADLVKQYRTTLIFTNTRSGTEHVAMRLKSRGIESLEAHHSSMGKDQRLEVENKLKNGELKCVITSTSLELGIDIGFIDLVIQIGSPKSVSKGLQRIGRSGHGVDELSKGIFIVFTLDDLVECAVLTKAAYSRQIDRVDIPKNPLDVLAQILVGMSLERVWKIEEAYQVLRNSYTFHDLSYDEFMMTMDYLSGELESLSIYPKIWVDRDAGTFGKKRSTRMIYFMNVGTIPDEANYKAINEKGKNVGELSDKFVERLKSGDVFVLGARTYIFEKTVRNRVYVRSVTGMKPTVPSWTGEMLPRSYDLGVMIGEFRKHIASMIEAGEDPTEMLIREYHVDENGARSIISYIKAQMDYGVPTEDHALIEGYQESDGVYGLIFHVPLGRKVNDALSRSYALAISNRYGSNTRITITDDGFIVYTERKIPIDEAIRTVNSSDFRDLVRRSIANTELFKQRFRHCAARSLMVLRSYKGYDISVARQQLRSDRLLNELQKHEGFSIIRETYREIMEDLMDVPRAEQYVRSVMDSNSYTVRNYTKETSPFSYGMIMAGSSDIVMMEDRSKMLRDLQSRMLEKIYGGEAIHFLFENQKDVEDYFRKKIPVVHDEESLIRFANHFPYIDVLKDRYNSPYQHAEGEVKELVEKAIEDGKIVSAYVRGLVWTSSDNYPILWTLFRKRIDTSDTEKEILDHCTGRSFSELKSDLNFDENSLKNALTKLESAYLIRRKMKDGITVFHRNEGEFSVDVDSAARRLIELTLSSYGPLTIDEIDIKIPLGRERIEAILKAMVAEGNVIYDYITPVYSKQYMLYSDLKSLTSVEDITKVRLSRITRKVNDPLEYFDVYGFAFDVENVNARLKRGRIDSFEDLVKSGLVIRGHFIKNKVTYASRWFIDTLFSLRDHTISAEERIVLNSVKDGITSEKIIAETTGMDKKIIRQIVRSLEYKLVLSRDGDSISLVNAQDIGYERALRTIIERFGPLTHDEIRRFFWFNPDLRSLSLNSVFFKGDLYYYTDRSKEIPSTSIIPVIDPVMMYLQIYVENIDYNRILIVDGEEVATFYLEEKDGVRWISDLSSTGTYDEVVKRLMDAYQDGWIVIMAGASAGRATAEPVTRPDGLIINYDESQMMGLAVKLLRKKEKKTNLYELLSEIYFGIRDSMEAQRYGISEMNVDNYYESSLLYQFNGPFDKTSMATREIISIYRSVADRKLDKDAEAVMRSIMVLEEASERQIMANVDLDQRGLKNILDSLYRDRYIARNYERKYVAIPQKYTRDEAIRLLAYSVIRDIGMITPSRFSAMIGIGTDESLRFLNDVEGCRRYFNLKTKEVYFSRGDLAAESARDPIEDAIFSSKDILSLIYGDYLKMIFGTGYDMFYFDGRSFSAALSVQRTVRHLRLKKFAGDSSLITRIGERIRELGYLLSIQNK